MIRSLELKNFRGFGELALDFEPDVTALVGVNGSGKTSVLDAIAFGTGLRDCSQSDVRLGGLGLSIRLRWEDGDGAKRFVVVESSSRSGQALNHEALDLLFYPTNRHVTDLTPGATRPVSWSAAHAQDSATDAAGAYEKFFHWLRDTEDRENEQMRYEGAREIPALAAVRRAVEALLPGFTDLRIRRGGAMGVAHPRLTVTKRGATEPLLLDALSEGERSLLAMVADIARRLAIAYPEDERPLERPLTVLIDEVELHLHPGWQRRLVGQLRKVFPAVQWIFTTQSPILVSELEPRCLRLLRDFAVVPLGPEGAGRDVNAVLEETFDTPARRDRERELLAQLQRAIDEGQVEEGRRLVGELAATLGDLDPEVVFHRSLIERLSTR